MKFRWITFCMCAAALAAGGCGEATVVASNCDDPNGCVKPEPAPLKVDAVDILLVLDNSGSIVQEAKQLQAELPRLLEALTTGADGDTSFPPASSVHVAVTTTDMGIGNAMTFHCTEEGQDGVFVRPGEVGLSCPVSYPGFLSYDGAPAPVATASSVACLPLVLPDELIASQTGCGYEQPLEAMLKSLWPSDRNEVAFRVGTGHGNGANGGFLREDSLLVVIVVSDEDDCSAVSSSIFDLPPPLEEDGAFNPSATPPNLVCVRNKDRLHDTERYIRGLKALRPDNHNLILGLIAGVPPTWVSDEVRADYDLSDEADVARYYDAILAAPEMQEVEVNPDLQSAFLAPSCRSYQLGTATAQPPRRLLEVAKGFGTESVLGSICAPEYGSTMGRIIRAVGQRLNTATTD